MATEVVERDRVLSPMWEFLSEEYDYVRPRRGDIRDGIVMRIEPDRVIVDIGVKKEGIVPSTDLEMLGEEAVAEIEVGDKVLVYVLNPENRDGDIILSLNLARLMEDWLRAEGLYERGEIFEAEVAGYNKGGLLVPFGRIRGFVPASQIVDLAGRAGGNSQMERLAGIVGETLHFKVIEVDRYRRRLILSERAAQRQWRRLQREKLLRELKEGDIRHGVVSNLCDFGAFVDLGGADGLIHVSELSWDRVKHPRELLQVGDEIDVYVLRVDRERKRIGLSLNRLRPDPWTLVEEKYQVGQLVEGTITHVVDFGAFARIEEGIEGLIHISELAEGNIFRPQDVVKEGDMLTLRVIGIDATRRRMGLSLRQVPPRDGGLGERKRKDYERDRNRGS